MARVFSQFPVLEWVYYRHVHDQAPLRANPAWTPLEGGSRLRPQEATRRR